jgi:hypothetical protein
MDSALEHNLTFVLRRRRSESAGVRLAQGQIRCLMAGVTDNLVRPSKGNKETGCEVPSEKDR